MDSCPAQQKISIAVKALAASLKIHFVLRYIIAYCFGFFLALRYLFSYLLEFTGLYRKNNRTLSCWEALLHDPNRCPQLFLFSKTDELTGYIGIEECIQQRLELGVKVHSICWDDSAHVLHFRQHRESYIQNCMSFLDSCLESSSEACACDI